MKTNNRAASTKMLAGFAIVLPILVFYGFHLVYSVNIPWFDDIENIPYFLAQWLEADTWSGRIEALLRPNNEHRVVSARLIVLLHHLSTGQINFATLNFVGNLTVLGIFLIVSRSYIQSGGSWHKLIPAAFFMFNLQFYSMTFMCIMSLQYQLIICEVFLSLYLLLKPQRWAFAFSVIISVLGTFSMGNGMMVWPTGVLLLIYVGQWQRLTAWIVVGTMAIVGYFSGYDFVQGNDEGFAYILQHPLKILVGFLAFVGGIWDWTPRISFEKRMIVPVLGGLLVCSFFVYYVLGAISTSPQWKKILPHTLINRFLTVPYFQRTSARWLAFWIGAFVYLLINSALVVFFRTRFDYQLVLWATYKIYPGTLMAMTSLLLIQVVRTRLQKILFAGFGMAALLSWASSYWYFVPQVQQDRHQRMAFAFNQQYNGVGLGAEKNSAFAKFIVNTFDRATKNGFYQFPYPLIAPKEKEIGALFNTPPSNTTVEIQKTGTEIQISSSEITFVKERGVFVALKSAQRLYLFSGVSMTPWWQPQAKGFTVRFPVSVIENDTYDVGIWLPERVLNKTKVTVTIP
jgi:hypothetical protein